MKDYRITNGRQLRAARALAGLTTKQLAELADLSAPVIVRLEARDVIEVGDYRRGFTRPETMQKIERALAGKGVTACREHLGVQMRQVARRKR